MKTTVDFSDFERAFADYNRKENFSYEGLRLLFEYFEEYEESTGEEVELDVIALCCDYAESSLSELASDYGIDLEGLEGEDRIEAIVSYMEQNTYVLGMVDDETMVYQQF
jgi:hypothetical protein